MHTAEVVLNVRQALRQMERDGLCSDRAYLKDLRVVVDSAIARSAVYYIPSVDGDTLPTIQDGPTRSAALLKRIASKTTGMFNIGDPPGMPENSTIAVYRDSDFSPGNPAYGAILFHRHADGAINLQGFHVGKRDVYPWSVSMFFPEDGTDPSVGDAPFKLKVPNDNAWKMRTGYVYVSAFILLDEGKLAEESLGVYGNGITHHTILF